MDSLRILKILSWLPACILLVAATWSKTSLYSASLTWVNDEGKPTRLSDWSGKKVVLAMAYTSCQGSCPLIMQKLRKVEKIFLERKEDISFVIVSFDPKNDTPQALHSYRKHADLMGRNWSFLTGKEADVRRLSMLLNMNYSKNPGNGEIMHENKIFLLSTSGEIIRTLGSLDEKETKLLE